MQHSLHFSHPTVSLYLSYSNAHKITNIKDSTLPSQIESSSNHGGVNAVTEFKRSINSDNARRKVDGRVQARLIELACGPVPEGHSRWTIRLLEEEAKVILETPVSREAIRNALKKTNFDLTKMTTGASRQKKIRNS